MQASGSRFHGAHVLVCGVPVTHLFTPSKNSINSPIMDSTDELNAARAMIHGKDYDFAQFTPKLQDSIQRIIYCLKRRDASRTAQQRTTRARDLLLALFQKSPVLHDIVVVTYRLASLTSKRKKSIIQWWHNVADKSSLGKFTGDAFETLHNELENRKS